jgi:class 3 adenylate cyclase
MSYYINCILPSASKEAMAWGPAGEEEDLFGTAVNMAARIAAKAEGGEILAPIVVRQLVAGKGFLFADRGETALRGFEDPVRLYEVHWREGQRFPLSG